MCCSPIRVRMPSDFRGYLYVSCGKCPECLNRKHRNAFVKLYYEFLYSTSAYFVTLTYNEDTCPLIVSAATGESTKTLHRKDLQAHLKRWRALCNKRGYDISNFHYFSASEYGANTLRPHYHILLFNVPDAALNLFNLLWEQYFGFYLSKKVVVSKDSFRATALYVSKYVTKSLSNDYFTNKLQELYFKKCEKMRCTSSHNFGCVFDTKLVVKDIFSSYRHYEDLVDNFNGFNVFINGYRYTLPSSLVHYLFTCEYEYISNLFPVCGRKMSLDWWISFIPVLSKLGFAHFYSKQLQEISDKKLSGEKAYEFEHILERNSQDYAAKCRSILEPWILKDCF